MRKFDIFITAVCVLFLVKLRWPKNKSLYNNKSYFFAVTSLKKKRNWSLIWRRLLPSVQNRSRPLRANAQRKNWKQRKIEKKETKEKPFLLCTYQCKSRKGGGGGGECGQGAGIWCLRLSPCRAFDRVKRPGVGTFDFDRQKPGINSETVTKSVPRGFLKVTLLEKGVKFSFVLIAII